MKKPEILLEVEDPQIAAGELARVVLNGDDNLQKDALLELIAEAKNQRNESLSVKSQQIYSDIVNLTFELLQKEDGVDREEFIFTASTNAGYIGFSQQVASDQEYKESGRVDARRGSAAASSDSVTIFNQGNNREGFVPQAYQDAQAAQRARSFTDFDSVAAPTIESIQRASINYFSHLKANPEKSFTEAAQVTFRANKNELIDLAVRYINSKESDNDKLTARFELAKVFDSSMGPGFNRADKINYVMSGIDAKLDEEKNTQSPGSPLRK